jgi:hypothetical protein
VQEMRLLASTMSAEVAVNITEEEESILPVTLMAWTFYFIPFSFRIFCVVHVVGTILSLVCVHVCLDCFLYDSLQYKTTFDLCIYMMKK